MKRVYWLLGFLVVAVVLSIKALATTDPCAQPLPGLTGVTSVNSIQLKPNNIGGDAPHFSVQSVSRAASAWNIACQGSQNPTLSTAFGQRTVNVNFIAGPAVTDQVFSCRNQSGIWTCGCTTTAIDAATGTITGATVRIYEKKSDGTACDSTYDDIVKHETGHVLGLKDVNCPNRIMGIPAKPIAQGDCDQIDTNFFTNAEIEIPFDHPCKPVR